MPESPTIGVVILAGGEAKRLPNKLSMNAGDVPMIVRVFRNVSPGRTTLISRASAESFAPEIEAQLHCPTVVDRWKSRGPLAGLCSTLEAMATPFAFAVAGDAPFVDAAFIDRLAAAWQAGDEAVVPRVRRGNTTHLEPLAALYDRRAFLREALPLLELHGAGASLHAAIARLNVREIDCTDGIDPRTFANVNTPADYAALSGSL